MAVREGDPGEKYKRKNSIGFDVDFFATPLGLVRVLETVSYYNTMYISNFFLRKKYLLKYK